MWWTSCFSFSLTGLQWLIQQLSSSTLWHCSSPLFLLPRFATGLQSKFVTLLPYRSSAKLWPPWLWIRWYTKMLGGQRYTALRHYVTGGGSLCLRHSKIRKPVIFRKCEPGSGQLWPLDSLSSQLLSAAQHHSDSAYAAKVTQLQCQTVHLGA